MKSMLVISDTHGHIPLDFSKFDEDIIFHAGDIEDANIMSQLFSFNSVFIVYGNCDFFEAPGIRDIVKTTIDGIRIMMVHNLSAPHRIMHSNQIVIDEFKPHIVIFGHSHTPLIRKENDILFVNPGSLGKPGFTGIYSYAKIAVENGEVLNVQIFDAETGEVVDEWKK